MTVAVTRDGRVPTWTTTTTKKKKKKLLEWDGECRQTDRQRGHELLLLFSKRAQSSFIACFIAIQHAHYSTQSVDTKEQQLKQEMGRRRRRRRVITPTNERTNERRNQVIVNLFQTVSCPCQ